MSHCPSNPAPLVLLELVAAQARGRRADGRPFGSMIVDADEWAELAHFAARTLPFHVTGAPLIVAGAVVRRIGSLA